MRIIDTGCCDIVSAILDALHKENKINDSLFFDIECDERENCRAYNSKAEYQFCPPECLEGNECNGMTIIPNDDAIIKLADELGIRTKIHYIQDGDGDYTFDVILP